MKQIRKEGLKIAEILFFLVGIPTGVFYVVLLRWPAFWNLVYDAIVGMFVLQAALIYGHTVSAFKRRSPATQPAPGRKPPPKTTLIVSAYLPNEVSVVEATLIHILQNVKRPPAGIEVILVYNTPRAEPLEAKILEMARQRPELILENARGSKSKSENLNHALERASGGMIVLLDADHLVSGDCIERAWRWLEGGYDAVQGLCKIRNAGEGLVPAVVGIEFEIKYGVYDSARSADFDTSFFGGSNGYWRAEAVKKIGFDARMLSEDIDTTLRGIFAGFRFFYDAAIISTELAPTTVGRLWFQRKRWAQGWLQCFLKHQGAVWKTRRLGLAQKFSWTLLLSGGVVYDVAAFLFFPLVLAFWLYRREVALPVHAYIVFAFFFILLAAPYQTFMIYKNATPPRAPLWNYFLYCLAAWPYAVFKTVLQMVAIRDELAGERTWTVSRRD